MENNHPIAYFDRKEWRIGFSQNYVAIFHDGVWKHYSYDEYDVHINADCVSIQKSFTQKEVWVRKWYDLYSKDPNCYYFMEVRDDKRYTVVYKGASCGMAICSPRDEFDSKTGIAIAYARLRGQAIPLFMFQ